MKTILIGSTVETYSQLLQFFKKLEEQFSCKVIQKEYYIFETTMNNELVEIIFTFGPTRDAMYKKNILFWKEKGRVIPPPADEVIQQIKGKKILVLSFYGGINASLNQTCLPVRVSTKLMHESTNKIQDFEQVSEMFNFKNNLVGKLNGKTCTHITTNNLLIPERFNSNEEFKEVVKILSNNGFETVDMELAYIVTNTTVPIYAVGTITDVLQKDELHMEVGVVKNDLDNHLRVVFEAISIFMDE